MNYYKPHRTDESDRWNDHSKYASTEGFSPAPYSVLEPFQMRLRRQDGTEVLMGYGIGDIITTLEPRLQLLVCCHDRLKEMPMADGSVAVDFPDVIGAKRWYQSDYSRDWQG